MLGPGDIDKLLAPGLKQLGCKAEYSFNDQILTIYAQNGDKLKITEQFILDQLDQGLFISFVRGWLESNAMKAFRVVDLGEGMWVPSGITDVLGFNVAPPTPPYTPPLIFADELSQYKTDPKSWFIQDEGLEKEYVKKKEWEKMKIQVYTGILIDPKDYPLIITPP